MDLVQKRKADNWKNFLTDARNKVPGAKKESIFKTDPKGKVGVVGSGRGMTDGLERLRNEFKNKIK